MKNSRNSNLWFSSLNFLTFLVLIIISFLGKFFLNLLNKRKKGILLNFKKFLVWEEIYGVFIEITFPAQLVCSCLLLMFLTHTEFSSLFLYQFQEIYLLIYWLEKDCKSYSFLFRCDSCIVNYIIFFVWVYWHTEWDERIIFHHGRIKKSRS